MDAAYGHLWMSQFKTEKMREVAKREWLSSLEKYTPVQMYNALERCKTDTAYRLLARELLKDDFELFVRHFFFWNYRKIFLFNSHHYKIIDFLKGVVAGKITYGIINMPPRYSKTELVIKLIIS